jgi:membrane-bound lytic murein transglycosylase D
MPSPAPRAARNVEALPQQIAITGAESAELQLLGAVDGAAPTTRGPRTSLFPRDLPATHDAYQRPRGLKRTELATHEDASVDGAIQYLATDARGHGALLAAVQRSGRYRDEVSRILQAWKIPSELAAVAFVESGFVPTASSLDGGAGLWSLVPEVAHAYGVAVLPTYDERRGFALSTEAAAHHLADLHERLGSWELALYAFGRGYARSLDDLRGQSSLEYWDIAPGLPAEGASYVAEVLAVATVLANPDRFGLDVVHPDEPLATSDLEVPADATFAILARAAGTPVDRLHELNPEYLGEAIPNTGFAMTVHLPGAALARAKELLMPLMYSPGASLGGDTPHRPRRDAGDVGAAAVPGEGSAASPSAVVVGRGASRKVYYRVQEGDTLDSLARRFALSRETIASDNSLDPAAGLKPDQLLLLRPGAGAAPAPSSTP